MFHPILQKHHSSNVLRKEPISSLGDQLISSAEHPLNTHACCWDSQVVSCHQAQRIILAALFAMCPPERHLLYLIGTADLLVLCLLVVIQKIARSIAYPRDLFIC